MLASQIPFSVMSFVINFAGVTSKAGLKVLVLFKKMLPFPSFCDLLKVSSINSFPLLTSIGINEPSFKFSSIVEVGRAT